MSDFPPGSAQNTAEHTRLLERATSAAMEAVMDEASAVAVVLITKAGDMTAAFSLHVEDAEHAAQVLARLRERGGKVLQITIDRAIEGHGSTSVVARK